MPTRFRQGLFEADMCAREHLSMQNMKTRDAGPSRKVVLVCTVSRPITAHAGALLMLCSARSNCVQLQSFTNAR